MAVSKPVRDMNCWTREAGSDSISSICPEGSAKGPVSVGPDRPGGRTGNLQGRRPALVTVLIGMWLSPTRRLGTGGFLYPCVWPSVSPPLLLP